MSDGRLQRLAAALIAAVAVLSAGLATQAQLDPQPSTSVGGPTLPAEVYAADPVTADQRAQIDAFAEYWAPRLRGAGDVATRDIVAARNRLQQPMLLPQTTTAFRNAFSQAVASRLDGAMDNDSLVVRLNVMIVASRLTPITDVVDLLVQGLEDESPAVRYWAIKGIVTPQAGGEVISPAAEDQRRLLDRLDTVLQAEAAPEVLEQVYKAMVELDAPANNALDRVIAALNRRVQEHSGNPELTYRPEAEGLAAAYNKVLREAARGGANSTDQLRQLARAAARYLDQLARHAANQQLPPQRVNEYKRLASLSYQILARAHEVFGSTAQIYSAQQFNAAVTGDQWSDVVLAAQQFREMLTNPPFNFAPAEVTPAAD